MYVRWVIRKHKNAATTNVTFHDAYLVESYRNDCDSPRQRAICYLGNIRELDGRFPAIERELFLIRAERILASTREVPIDEREFVLSLLRQKVPELTAEEVRIAFRGNLNWYYRWWRDHGNAPTREELLSLVERAADGIGSM